MASITPPQLQDLGLGEVRSAELSRQQPGAGARWPGPRPGLTSRVGFPSRRSSPTGLPVTRWIAEDVEQVVAELKGLAEGQPEGRQGTGQLAGPGGRSQGGPEVEGPLDGVLGRLVPADPPGPVDHCRDGWGLDRGPVLA